MLLILDTGYRPGDTVPALQKFLKEIADESHVSIPFHKSNVFCFDSESFRYLALAKNNVPVDGNKSDYERSWNESVSNTKRLLEHVKSLTQMSMKDIIVLNKLKQVRFEQVKTSMQLIDNLLEKRLELEQQYQQNYSLLSSTEISKMTDNITQINTTVERMVEILAYISFKISRKTISVFNDDIEAYFEESIRSEHQRSYLLQRQSDLKVTLMNLHDKYKKCKILAAEPNFNLKKSDCYLRELNSEISVAQNLLVS